jgi:hypothetical protein
LITLTSVSGDDLGEDGEFATPRLQTARLRRVFELIGLLV